MRTDDELALRAALVDVTEGQPDLPVDRVAGVRRKHVRRRQLQAVAGACAVAVVAASAVAIGGTLNGARTAQPLNRDLPSWALPWVDHRDGSVSQQVLTGAVRRWADKQRADAPLPKSQPIQMDKPVWYVGQRIPGTDQVLAVFEASGLRAGALPLTKGNRLVVATTPWDLVRLSTPGVNTNWTFIDVAAPPHNFTGFLGGYIPVPKGDNGIHNVAWLLTSPRARSASWSVGAPGGNTLSGSLPLESGFASIDVGPVSSRLRVTALATGPEGQSVPAGGYLGVPGVPSSQVPTLAPAGDVTGYPQGRLTLGESAGQGSSTYVDEDAKAPAGRSTTIYARCYSAGPAASIRVAVDVDSAVGGVRIPCDDRQHVVRGNPTVTDPHAVGRQVGHAVLVRAGQLTTWTVAVVIAAR